jgi:putative transposase
MKKLTQMLLGKGYSASTISEINKSLNGEMKEWLNGPIEDDVSVIFIDGVNLPVRRFHVSKESLLVALGITRAGRRRILGVSLGQRESSQSWKQFLGELVHRGLKGSTLKVGVMDGLAGLENAFEEVFPKALIQRCMVHKTWNVAAKLPQSIQAGCLAQMKRIFNAKDETEARDRAAIWKSEWMKVAPNAVECLFKDLDACLIFYRFPKKTWRKIRTTNIIERMFKEFRRRTRSMDSFPNEECCLRCIYAISRNLDQVWGRIRLWRGDLLSEIAAEDYPNSRTPEYDRKTWELKDKILEPSAELVPA